MNYPFLPVPTELSFEPINLCNAKCYCCPYAWLGEDADYRGKKMTPEQIEILIEDFANGLKIHRVQEWNAHIQPWRFSDPLVCPSLELILELADRFKINVIITTNGISFTDKNCRILDKYQHLIKKINIYYTYSTTTRTLCRKMINCGYFNAIYKKSVFIKSPTSYDQIIAK